MSILRKIAFGAIAAGGLVGLYTFGRKQIRIDLELEEARKSLEEALRNREEARKSLEEAIKIRMIAGIDLELEEPAASSWGGYQISGGDIQASRGEGKRETKFNVGVSCVHFRWTSSPSLPLFALLIRWLI